MSYELVDWMNHQKRKQATIDDACQAIDHALESAAECFANVWVDASEKGRAVLEAMVRMVHDRDVPESVRAHQWLREHEILGQDGAFLVSHLLKCRRGRNAARTQSRER